MTKPPAPKRKSEMRWQIGRELYARICPSLPTASHVAVLMFCWFQASGKDCRFSVAHCQIANVTKLSRERVRKIMSDLVAGGVVRPVRDSIGPGYACERAITGKPYHPKRVVTHDPPKAKRVVTHDR